MTIKDVAKKAGVSVATVSRVLNNPEFVKQSTKDRVLAVVKELNYTPNLLGRNLRRLETKKIMVVLDNISNPFYSNVVKGVEDRAKEDNFTVMLCTMRSSIQNFNEAMKLLQNKVVDGALVLCGDLGEEGNLKQMATQYPILCLCEIVSGVSSVSIDDYRAGFDATEYLIKQGKKNIAIVARYSDIHKTNSFGLRLRGYRDALIKNGLQFDKDLVIEQDEKSEEMINTTKVLLSLKNRPDAVFCLSDTVAIKMIKELSLNGISVPDDMSVMGIDNTLMSEMFIPSITTVAQPQYEIGYKGTDILLQKMSCKDEAQKCKQVFLKHNIINRKSVK